MWSGWSRSTEWFFVFVKRIAALSPRELSHAEFADTRTISHQNWIALICRVLHQISGKWFIFFGDRQTIKPWFFRIFKDSEQNFHIILHWLKGKNGNKFGKIWRSSTYLKMHISRGKSDWTHAKKNKPVTEWDRRLIYLSSWCTLTESPTKSQFLISNRWKMIENKNSPNNFIYISNVYRKEMSIT